jgi:adenylate cyclase
MQQIQSLIARLAAFGVRPEDSDDVRVQKAIFSVVGGLVGVLLIVPFGPIYLYYGEIGTGLIYVFFGLTVLLHIWLAGHGYLAFHRAVLHIALLSLPDHLAASLFLGGYAYSHGVIFWGLFFPVLGSLIFFPARYAIGWFFAFILNLALSIFLQPWLEPGNQVPPLVGQLLLFSNLFAISLFALSMMYYFVNQRAIMFGLLRLEQEKSEKLLLNILPSEIAAILKNETRTIADQFEGASILFADVANFTPLSAGMTPSELVGMLNEVFSDFDSLAEKYELEKIKTIGDSYMVAAGVPRARPDHAKVLTRMALEMRDLVSQRTFHGQRLNFRIGINSGPVVAGVIGRKKFIYDLWGDAVNTASRMESHGKANVIQITRATYDLIQEAFICEPQGVIPIKGKGDMEVWHVLAER